MSHGSVQALYCLGAQSGQGTMPVVASLPSLSSTACRLLIDVDADETEVRVDGRWKEWRVPGRGYYLGRWHERMIGAWLRAAYSSSTV